MSARDSNRTSDGRPSRSARRGLELVFWIVFLLGLGVGGPSALAGFPALLDSITPTGVFEAEASADWQDMVVQPLAKLVTPEPPPPAADAAAELPKLPAIALVIDDMGGAPAENRRAIALPPEVSLAFLPYPEDTPRLAEEAKRAGHEILVHVPMESPRRNDLSLTQALRRDLPAAENARRFAWALSRVPGYSGINNHEGSLFTANRLALIPVAEALYGRGLYFLDSRTTPLSQVVPVARAFGVPSSDRDVFLDDDPSPRAIQHQLAELLRVARAQGIAIAIGHPHAATLDALTKWCAENHGIRLIPVSTAIRMKTEWEMGVEVGKKKNSE